MTRLFSGTRVTIADAGAKLAGLRPSATYQSQTLRATITALANEAGVSMGRVALAAPTQARATVINRERGGKGVSAQAFALRSKIQEVAQAKTTATVIEVHPELTFRVLGAPRFSKKSWAGVRERLAILESEGLHPLDWVSAGWATTDDTLDAAAAALSAGRFALGRARPFPQSADRARIWA